MHLWLAQNFLFRSGLPVTQRPSCLFLLRASVLLVFSHVDHSSSYRIVKSYWGYQISIFIMTDAGNLFRYLLNNHTYFQKTTKIYYSYFIFFFYCSFFRVPIPLVLYCIFQQLVKRSLLQICEFATICDCSVPLVSVSVLTPTPVCFDDNNFTMCLHKTMQCNTPGFGLFTQDHLDIQEFLNLHRNIRNIFSSSVKNVIQHVDLDSTEFINCFGLYEQFND